LVLILLVSCTQVSTPTPTQISDINPDLNPVTDHLVISEILAGVEGNNNLDFIELYNPTQEMVNLQGYSLWYQLKKDQEDVLIHSWETSAFIPPNGHYLLLRENQELEFEVDAYFDYSLVPQRGSLALRSKSAGLIDQVAWGDTDADFVETTSASAFPNGSSLERLPGGQAGNGQDFNNNAEDFIISKSPKPQTSASIATPETEKELELKVAVPSDAKPGSTLVYDLAITNMSQQIINSALLHFPFPKDLIYESSSIEPVLDTNLLQFELGDLSPNAIEIGRAHV